ncbi:MAG: hypothetical protein AAGK71_03940 [Pseudomonadota bacterium]
MKSLALQIFCWLALGVTALGAFFLASAGTLYSAEQDDAPYFLFAMAPPIVIAILLVLIQRVRRGPVQFLTMIVCGAVGVILSGLEIYNLVFFPENWLNHIAPLLLGLGLLALAFEPALRWRS